MITAHLGDFGEFRTNKSLVLVFHGLADSEELESLDCVTQVMITCVFDLLKLLP